MPSSVIVGINDTRKMKNFFPLSFITSKSAIYWISIPFPTACDQPQVIYGNFAKRLASAIATIFVVCAL